MQYVLVTGAGRGLGRALISELAGRGWTVIALVRSRAHHDALSEQFREKVKPLCCDLTSPQLEDQVEDFFRRSGIRSLDCLVNNAGLASRVSSLADIDVSEVRRLLDVNLMGPIRMTKACLPQLLQSEAPLVLNISSRLGSLAGTAKKAAPDSSYSYRISKAALNMFTLCMAVDPSLRGVKVLSVHPGSIRTEMGGAAAADSAEAAAKKVVAVIDNVSPVESGAFLNADGGRLEW